jgi:acetoin utilization deacetylase AcuC-like enzyme
MQVIEHIVQPALQRFKPDLIVVACGYDAAAIDPLSRMLATAQTFSAMTAAIKASAEELCSGRLVLVHEGGYSEVYVPFCGHATISTLANSTIVAPDPFAETFAKRQPRGKFADFIRSWVDDLAVFHRS